MLWCCLVASSCSPSSAINKCMSENHIPCHFDLWHLVLKLFEWSVCLCLQVLYCKEWNMELHMEGWDSDLIRASIVALIRFGVNLWLIFLDQASDTRALSSVASPNELITFVGLIKETHPSQIFPDLFAAEVIVKNLLPWWLEWQ